MDHARECKRAQTREMATGLLLDGCKEFTTGAVFHDHEETIDGVKGMIKMSDERMFRCPQESLFRQDGFCRLRGGIGIGGRTSNKATKQRKEKEEKEERVSL